MAELFHLIIYTDNATDACIRVLFKEFRDRLLLTVTYIIDCTELQKTLLVPGCLFMIMTIIIVSIIQCESKKTR